MGLLLTHVLKYHRELAELVVGGGEQTGQECGVRTHRSVVCAHAGVQCVQKQECGVCTLRSVVCAKAGLREQAPLDGGSEFSVSALCSVSWRAGRGNQR